MSPSQLFISIARMHHISNPSKFRRLRRFAEHSNVSGFVKKGKPGVLLFEGYETSVKEFLEHARGLRYLDFHHVDTKPFLRCRKRLSEGKNGLQEVNDMNELIIRVDSIGEKEWFRSHMGMSKGSTA
ncbi:hypothetical protein CPB84DRAFT_1844047 [Gymnopilus junonius]|uniref:Uncharacterized protein n=1 Tax=Gymnopilus junonius TaxID=109634 RepID=A0A9P5NUU0_GYMJU|nr:hypothetical protein CPB84DRAFT_1844047 [Gymnopilus junonius]